MNKILDYLKKNRIILISIVFLLLTFTVLAFYFSPYYLDRVSPQIEVRDIEEQLAYREVIEFTVYSTDEKVGIKVIRVLVDEDSVEFEKKLEQHPKENIETVKVDTSKYTDGEHKFSIDVVDASWWQNRKRIEFKVIFDNTPPKVELILKPESVVQGNTLMIIAKPNESVVDIKCSVFGRTTEFYRKTRENRLYYRTLIGISVHQEPGRHVIDVIAKDKAGNRSKKQNIVKIIKGEFERGFVHLPKNKKSLLTDSEARRIDYTKRAKAYSHFEPKQLWQGKSIRPAKGRISSSFGKQRIYNNGVRKSTHLGIDIANTTGTPVKASNSGVIVLAEKLPISGNAVIIDHGQRVFSTYYHLNNIFVHKGEEVEKGQVIGGIGTTGQSTGSHLHWGFIVNGVSVNPIEWTVRDYSYSED